MTTFILIIMVLSVGQDLPTTTTTIEFTSERTCLEAAVKIRDFSEKFRGREVYLACVKK